MPFVSAAGDNYCTRFSSYQSTVASGYSKLTRHQPVWSDTSLVTLVECKDNTHWIKYCTMMTVRRNRSDSQGKEWDGIRGYENLGLCKQCTVP